MDNKLKILEFLARHRDDRFTMHELSRLISIPYATFFRATSKMNELIIKNKVGKATTIQINLENPIVKHYLIIASEQKAKDLAENHPLFKKIRTEVPKNDYSLILFGSYATGKQTKTSDIDLLIINKKGEKKPSFSKYETIFKVTINPIYVTEKEFKIMLMESGENIGKQALKDHIILYNPELFWNLVI